MTSNAQSSWTSTCAGVVWQGRAQAGAEGGEVRPAARAGQVQEDGPQPVSLGLCPHLHMCYAVTVGLHRLCRPHSARNALCWSLHCRDALYPECTMHRTPGQCRLYAHLLLRLLARHALGQGEGVCPQPARLAGRMGLLATAGHAQRLQASCEVAVPVLQDLRQVLWRLARSIQLLGSPCCRA